MERSRRREEKTEKGRRAEGGRRRPARLLFLPVVLLAVLAALAQTAAGAAFAGRAGNVRVRTVRAENVLAEGRETPGAAAPVAADSGATAPGLPGESSGAVSPDSASSDSAAPPAPYLFREETGSLIPGQSLTVTLYSAGLPAFGFEGDMVFEDSLLAFSSAESLLPGWSVYFTKQHFLLCGDTMESPLQSDSPVPVCRFVFHVKEDAAAGSALTVLLENFTVTDGGQPVAPGDPSFSGRIAFPDTGKARLRALSAGDYPMTPAFSPDLFSYTVRDLPHDLETLPLSYTPSSEGLTVTENFPSLADGKTVLTLTVTAEDGSETVYTVTALRKFGDGYQPSSEGRVGSLVPSAGTLSPPFSPDCTEYILYLPAEYAGKTLTLVPTPLSDSAEAEAVTAMLGAEEKDGDARKDVSLLSVVCMAEDGSEVAYEVTAMLLPPYEGVPPYVESGTALQGTLEIEQTGDGYFARTALSRPDGRYDLRWSFNGADLGSGETLPRQDGLRDGVLTATLTGRDGFSGELRAEVTLDGEGNLTDKTGDTPSAVDPRAAAIVCGASVAALAIGFLAGIPAGKRRARRRCPQGSTD